MNHQFHRFAKEAILDIVDEQSLHVEGLTRDQLTEVIFQMIKSGDITNLVSTDNKMQVTYVPYREVRHLRAEVDRLSELLQKVKNILR